VADRDESIAFDRIADQYDETRGGTLEPLFSTHGRTLEIGIGTGIVALPLRESGRDVVGIDISLPMLTRAHSRIGSRVAIGDALRLPVADASVDDAYSVWVLHLVADVRRVLEEVARVLRERGRYIVVTSPMLQPDDDVGALTWAMQRSLRGPAQDDPLRVTALAAQVGLHLAESRRIEQTDRSQTPAEVAELIERRVFSALWDLDEGTWQETVEPTIAAIRALPDQDRRRTATHVNELVVLEKS
jgi:SAM-dependent methyltransferase